MVMVVVTLILFLTAVPLIHGMTCDVLEGPFTGQTSRYDPVSGKGACRIDFDEDMAVGIAADNFQNSQVCGECLEVTGPTGNTVVVTVVDQCFGCETDGMKMSRAAFESLGVDPVGGKINITWTVVACSLTGNIGFRFKENSNEWWLGIQPYNHAYPIARMQVQTVGTDTWVEFERFYNNFFMKPSEEGDMEAPFNIKMTSTNGLVAEASISEIISDETIKIPGDSSSQFQCTQSLLNQLKLSIGRCLVDEAIVHAKGLLYEVPETEGGFGMCNLDTGGDMMVGAISDSVYEDAQACGACIEVTGPTGEVVFVKIVDRCPSHECSEGDIDLGPEAFYSLAGPSDDNIDIHWKMTECPVYGNIKYRFKEGSSKWWFGIQIVNHRVPVISVSIRPGGHEMWIPLERKNHNFFVEAEGAVIPAPFDIRVTAITNEVLEDTITEILSSQDELQEGTAQFDTKCVEEAPESSVPEAPNYEGYTGDVCPVKSWVRTGKATFYAAYNAAGGGGNCMIHTAGDMFVGAMADPAYDGSKVCGECVQITGSDGKTVVIKIVDRCPICHMGDIDLSPEAFLQLAEPQQGRIDMSWIVVECPTIEGNIRYRFKDGSTRWWFGIQILDHLVPVRAVHIKPENTWIKLERQHYNFFLKPDGITVDPPFDIKVVGTTGKVLLDIIPYLPEDATEILLGNVQFTSACKSDDDIIIPAK